jgi:hypothetical protein
LPYVEYRRYVKWQSSAANSLNRFYLSLEIVNLAKFIRMHNDFAGIWCEIQTEKGVIRSDINQLNPFGNYKYGFPLEHDLADTFLLKIFTCKGLEC